MYYEYVIKVFCSSVILLRWWIFFKGVDGFETFEGLEGYDGFEGYEGFEGVSASARSVWTLINFRNIDYINA